MSDFKVGDRVVYEATRVTCTPSHEGHEGQITKVNNQEAVSVKWDDSNLANRGGYLMENLRHIAPAPDLITINRADLPDVRPLPSGLLRVGGSNYHDRCTAAEWRESANRRLALAGYVEARGKAAEEAAAAEKEAKGKLNRRKDVMAREMYLEAFGKDDGINYQNRNLLTQLCIDRIIELEDAAN